MSYEDDNYRHWDDGLSFEERKKNIEEAKKSRDALTLNILETIKDGEEVLAIKICHHIAQNKEYFDLKNYPVGEVFKARFDAEVLKTIDILKTSLKNDGVTDDTSEVVMSVGNFMARMLEDYIAIKSQSMEAV